MKWIEIWAMLQVGAIIGVFGVAGVILLISVMRVLVITIKNLAMELRGTCSKCKGEGKIIEFSGIGTFTYNCRRCNGSGHSKYFKENSDERT